MLWDYHVILMFRNTGSRVSNDSKVSDGTQVRDDSTVSDGWHVYDLDTLLGAPIPIAKYIESTFGDPSMVPAEFGPKFRVIDADEFVSVFSSDRSHMLTADGRWQVQPPPWPAIIRNGSSNLMTLVDMQNPSVGTVMDLSQFEASFAPE